MTDATQIRHSDACERNKQPILDVLSEYIGDDWRILEVGCGTGQHAVHFADQLPEVTWIPADRPGRLESIRARRQQANLQNLDEPIALDLFDDDLPIGTADALVAINVLHIAPWEATEQLFAHAERLLRSDDTSPDDPPIVYIYGPFKYEDRPLEESNQRFDSMLQARDPQMGLRLAGDVADRARDHGFQLVADRAMPANNRSLVFQLSS
jgi:SAM-dependent methyltransferase